MTSALGVVAAPPAKIAMKPVSTSSVSQMNP
jgi:hypothetical protein